MTIAVCFSCGAMKFGAFTPCDSCKIEPTEEDELILSLILTHRRFPIPELEGISELMMRGEFRPVVNDETRKLYGPAARDAQRMLGLKPRSSNAASTAADHKKDE